MVATTNTTSNKTVIGGDTPNDGKVLGNDAADKVAFHGATPAAQVTLTSLATGSTSAALTTSVQEIIGALQTKGLFG